MDADSLHQQQPRQHCPRPASHVVCGWYTVRFRVFPPLRRQESGPLQPLTASMLRTQGSKDDKNNKNDSHERNTIKWGQKRP